MEGSAKNIVQITELSGYGLTQENTFEMPDAVVPKEEEVPVEENRITKRFLPHSVTILVFKGEENNKWQSGQQ